MDIKVVLTCVIVTLVLIAITNRWEIPLVTPPQPVAKA